MTDHAVDQIIEETRPSSPERSVALNFKYSSDLLIGATMMDRAVGTLARGSGIEYKSDISMAVTMLWANAWTDMVAMIGRDRSIRIYRAIAKDAKAIKLPKPPPEME
jgi:hypothetical protein